jgi:hypothetical protein
LPFFGFKNFLHGRSCELRNKKIPSPYLRRNRDNEVGGALSMNGGGERAVARFCETIRGKKTIWKNCRRREHRIDIRVVFEKMTT